ncbi:hypothetical protein CCMSSC00406_0005874 [Pleurotus cornucopiae]|uniref:Uncharacterized protein n=1 Tax=Pleurotus cornucopiae TaxID=5321 RepID=A0ACB7IKT9_PLECO|nr:hypothetical protein CCMSSC00406_0005874 [Pleurotus cornucopiae]
MKDVWLEDSALTEAQIQSQIFEDIQKFFRDKQDARYLAFERLRPSISDLERNDSYKKYFIQIVADYEGRRTKPRSPNSERERKLFSTVEPIALPTTPNWGGSGTPRPTESRTTFDKGLREFAPRKQYRVIFGEVCEAVGDLGTVGEVADVLSQAIVALRLMYCAGWVHRDISSGNILAHRRSSSSPWQAKLSDLEYARQFSDSDRNVGGDPKTGTPYFMPHEILSARYIAPLPVTEQEPELGDNDFRDGGAPQSPEPPPVYNFQHDLESIWWIFVWTITCRVSHEPSIAFGRTIFQNLMEPPLARLRFLEDTITQRFMGCLLSPLQQLAGPLEVLRSFMVDAYSYRRRANGLADLSSYVKAHQGFVIFFEKVKQSQAAWGDTVLTTYHRPVATMTSVPSAANIAKPTRHKRPRDDDAYVADAEGQRPKSRRSDIDKLIQEEFAISGVEAYLSSYLPFEPNDSDIDNVVQLLSKTASDSAVSTKSVADFSLTDFPILDTPTSHEHLTSLAEAIASCMLQGRSHNGFTLCVCPNISLGPPTSNSNSKIDGCFTSEGPRVSRLTVFSAACVLMFTLDPTKEVENNIEAVAASIQIMNDDARRMFTYGITIVEDRVTLWYHSRSHSMISEPFSFVENPRLLIKVFMSFLFATEEELGYDPMVTRDAKGDYIYRIPSTEQGQQRDRFFRTTASIAEYRSNNITGRMTRVWKVVECNPSGAVLSPSGPSRVLKDVWLEDSALTEAQIQSQIFEDIQKFFRDKQDARYLAFEELQPSISHLERNDSYKKYFIQIVTDYEGRRTKPRSPNSERKRRLFSNVKPIALPTTSNRGGSGTPRPTESKITFDEGPREFAPRKQYRVIFGEVCEAVGDLGTVGEVADVLSQAIVALRLMYCAGWVHRDISSGNILAHPSGGAWQAKLSDLEYSRRFSFDLERDVHRKIDLDTFVKLKGPGAAPMPLVYNFQHDLESIWWIFLWTVTCRVSHPPSIVFGQDIFKNTMQLSSERSKCLQYPIESSLLTCLMSPLQQLAAPLETLRKFMANAYMFHHKDQDWSNLSSYIHIHNVFHMFFAAIDPSPADWSGIALVTSHQPIASIAEVGSTADLNNNVVEVPNISNPTRRKPSRPKRTLPRDDDDYVPNSKGEGSQKSTLAKRSRGG